MRLPSRYTTEGADVSPPLEWSEAPDAILIMEGIDEPAPEESDPPHRYVFRLAPLNLEVPTRAPKRLVADIWEQARPLSLAEASLTGTYVSRFDQDQGNRT